MPMTKIVRARARVLALAGALLVAVAAHGTTLLAFDLDGLAARSDVVVVGTVADARTVDGPDGLLTETTIVVEDALRGPPRATLVVSQLGGTRGPFVTDLVGDARLARGARVLLFTYAHDDGRRYLSGMAQGAFHDAGGGRFTQRLDVALIDATGAVVNGPHHRAVTLDDVVAALARTPDTRGRR